ncbi:MAG: endopeptidase La [Ruminococcaceae bacterium]|nr:endopeptidase La [Oscillospiraceae bacterium]
MSEHQERIFITENMPMMALRGLTVFPEMILNFDVERSISINALNAASQEERRIFLVAQKDILKEDPEEEDLYQIGTVCNIRQFIRGQNGTMRVLVEGQTRARLVGVTQTEGFFRADVLMLPERQAAETPKSEAMLRQAIGLYDEYTRISGNESPETLIGLTMRSDLGYTADYIIQNIFLRHTEKQLVLETIDPTRRLNMVNNIMAREVQVLSIEQQMGEKLQQHLTKLQKENVLREQIKVIRQELGEDDEFTEIDEYRSKIKALHLEREIEEKLLKETDRLSRQPFGSAEATVIRGYLDTCLEIPWNTYTKERLNIKAARKVLDDEHFGLDKVKERIVEFLAVRQLAPDMKGTIICLVGPPGVGKTSIAISIAKAVNRKLYRMSLGGIHDEAEIRGHRKTYVGAMPGRLINGVIQAKSMNPLLLLDEIDKLGSDHRGDPASALLEALDPEQNKTFRDHYLEVPFDLSNVMFITTANTTDTIPRPLLDRMEVIELSSYTDEEKLRIAKDHLIVKQRKKHGLNGNQLRITDDAIRDIIAGYTRESGVRLLEREIAAICRKTAAKVAQGEVKSLNVKSENLDSLLGVRKYKPDALAGNDRVGVVNGLAWTRVGGEILEIEAAVVNGTGKLELTGNLGDVMKESARAAVTYIRSRAERLGIDPDFHKNKDIHIHFPEGAVPKDGPSAGIAVSIAVISALTGTPVRRDVAMTGEITLTGRVLAIGGLKEKTMAAMRAGIRTVIIPAENLADLEEIDQTVRRALNFVSADMLDGILDTALAFSIRTKDVNEKADDMLTFSDNREQAAVIRQ